MADRLNRLYISCLFLLLHTLAHLFKVDVDVFGFFLLRVLMVFNEEEGLLWCVGDAQEVVDRPLADGWEAESRMENDAAMLLDLL